MPTEPAPTVRMHRVRLPGNKTFPVRHALLLPASLPGAPVVGSLSIAEMRVDTEDVKHYLSIYSLLEMPRTDGRHFQFTKPLGAEIYHVYIAPRKEDDKCDCEGFKAFQDCKHCQSLRALINAGCIKKGQM